MTETRLLEAVARAVRAVNEGTIPDDYNKESRLVEDLALDSLDLVAVIMELQDQIGVELDVDAVGGMQCVGDLITQIQAALPAQAA